MINQFMIMYKSNRSKLKNCLRVVNLKQAFMSLQEMIRQIINTVYYIIVFNFEQLI